MSTPLSATEREQLLQAARAARGRGYAPYSRFQVGAAVLGDNGKVYAGCNVENAAYPQGTCAEAGAIAAMVHDGVHRLRAVAVAGPDGTSAVTPCGGCRQKLREFAADAAPVLVTDTSTVLAEFTLGQLLPASFGPDHLGKGGAA